MKKITYILFIFLLTAVACSKNAGIEGHDGDVMNIVPQFNLTKVHGEQFEEGDKIGVYLTRYVDNEPSTLLPGGNYKNNNALVFTSGKWVADPLIFWEDAKFDLYGYYPYNPDIDNVSYMPFRLAEDQSTPAVGDVLGGYEASDFLWARNKGIEKTASVPLVFSHRMSKLTVNFKKGPEYDGVLPEAAKVILHNTVIDSRIDLSSGVVVKDREAAPVSITMKKVSTGKYTAIVVPQRIDIRKPLIEVICEDVSYMVNAMFIFKPNVHHTINVILDSNPDKVKIEIGGEIEGGWE